MSTIVSPYPPVEYDKDWTPPPEAQWWRMRLQPNEDNYLYVTRTNATDEHSTPTWVEMEFFDGETTILDAGLDKPNVFKCRLEAFPPSPMIQMDLLCIGRPTPSPHWLALAGPGKPHPEGEQ